MKVKTNVRAGKLSANYNEAVVRNRIAVTGLPVHTRLKAGVMSWNHNPTLVSA